MFLGIYVIEPICPSDCPSVDHVLKLWTQFSTILFLCFKDYLPLNLEKLYYVIGNLMSQTPPTVLKLCRYIGHVLIL